jgi:heme oxygenase
MTRVNSDTANLRSILRASTEQTHLIAEDHMSHLVSPHLTRCEYIDTLLRMASFHTWFETSLTDLQKSIPYAAHYLEERRKLYQIQADLKDLGVTLLTPIHYENLTTLESGDLLARFWGMLYVIEGSTLGGRVIAKNLKKTLNLSDEFGARFFSGYGSNTGQMWKNFLSALDDAQPALNYSQVIDSADLTFKVIAGMSKQN